MVDLCILFIRSFPSYISAATLLDKANPLSPVFRDFLESGQQQLTRPSPAFAAHYSPSSGREETLAARRSSNCSNLVSRVNRVVPVAWTPSRFEAQTICTQMKKCRSQKLSPNGLIPCYLPRHHGARPHPNLSF